MNNTNMLANKCETKKTIVAPNKKNVADTKSIAPLLMKLKTTLVMLNVNINKTTGYQFLTSFVFV